jgi:hypothetical protein
MLEMEEEIAMLKSPHSLSSLSPRAAVRRALPAFAALALLVCGALVAPAAQAHDRADAKLREVHITAHDNGSNKFWFTMPTSVPTGLVEFRFSNRGSTDHMAQFFKLKDDVSQAELIQHLKPLFTDQNPSDVAKAMQSLLRITSAAGGADSITPGNEQDVIERLSAGHYVVVCFDTTANGTPHFLLGMAKSFWASDRAWAPVDRDDPLSHGSPRTSGTILEYDHSIVVPHEITEREPLLLKISVRDQSHEFQLWRVPNGTTRAQLLQCLTGPQSACTLQGQPIDAGGTAALAPGHSHWVELHLKAGTYAAVCFVPDVVTGMPHALMGMVTVFTVHK